MNQDYQTKQKHIYLDAVSTGNHVRARDAVWRAASNRNLIDEAKTPELSAQQANQLRVLLGW